MSGFELMGAVDFAIEGIAPELGYSQPIVPNTKQIGFLHVQPPKPLPTEFQKFFDEGSYGVVYVSFGSNVKSSKLGQERIQMMLETFSELKYHVLWKFEDESLIKNKPKNVMISKWVPQQDILAHKNVKLFVTQGGSQSREEAIERGVPMLLIPFYGDQSANGVKVEELGVGKMLLQPDFNRGNFKEAIESIIEDELIQQKVKSLSALVRDSIMTPVETAAWWIEYAIRNRGASHLKYKGARMPSYQYYFIDILAAHFVIVYLAWVIAKTLVKKLLKTCTVSKQKQNVKRKNKKRN